jgi:PAS domain S-box-containing protein
MNIEQSTITELKEHWAKQVQALDQSAIVVMTDLRGVITYVNPKFCELSEYSRDELLGQTHALINSGYHETAFFKEMWQSIGRGQVWRGEIRNRAKSGKIYWVDTTIVPITDEHERPREYIAIRYDITSRKQAEENLANERARLIESEKMASIGILSAGIAHELGNPLGAIRGRLEMLQTLCGQDTFEKDFALRSIDKMIENVDRMSRIIRALKSSARDGQRDEMQEFDLTQLIGDILEISTQKCTKYQVQVQQEGLDKAHRVWGRETEIGQVIVNLFNNAFDAVRDRDNSWIKIRLKDEPDRCLIEVLDSGPGVDEAALNRIFDPFFTTKQVGEGTGLGLSICRSFVEGHGGQLVYAPVNGKCCFQVSLPRKT